LRHALIFSSLVLHCRIVVHGALRSDLGREQADLQNSEKLQQANQKQVHRAPDAIFLFEKEDVMKASSKQSPSETVFTTSMSFSAAWYITKQRGLVVHSSIQSQA
jgi:hypothetical protein